MSEKSPVSTENVLVPRSPKPGEDISTRHVEVWKIVGENPDGTIRADSQEKPTEIQIVDPDSKLRRGEANPVERQVPSKDLDESITSPEGQYALARELAGKPLRGDTVVANVNGRFTELAIGDYADTAPGAPRVLEMYDAEGKMHHQEEAVTHPQTQANMRQYKENQDRRDVEVARVSPEALSTEEIKEVGEATLDAAEVEERIDASRTETAADLKSVVDRVEAKPPAWSKEAREAERAASAPTREHPRMFDLDEGVVRSITYYTADGKAHPGVLAGMFLENGTDYAVIKPEGSPDGTYLTPEMSWIENRTLKDAQEAESVPAPDKIPSRDELFEMMSGEPRTVEEIIQTLPERRRTSDKNALQSYATVMRGLKRKPGDPGLEFIRKSNERTMSPEAQKVKDRYVELANAEKAA